MGETATIRELVDEALAKLDDPSASVASHVRRAIRIATKRQDYVAQIRLIPETHDLASGKLNSPAMRQAQADLVLLVGPEEADNLNREQFQQYQQCRARGDGNLAGSSVDGLEWQLKQLTDTIESYKNPPANLTPIDTYFVLKQNDKNIGQLLPDFQFLSSTLSAIRQTVYNFLIETERQMEAGQTRPDIFDRGREYLARRLLETAPDALHKMQAAEDAIATGEPESLAHALTSCRRVMKALADALYPATGETVTGADGRERQMTDEAYRNRLLQFATDHIGGGSHGRLLAETIRSLGNRLERLISLTSKGVHDEVSILEAETCLMWTYLTAADFLRIADGTALVDETHPLGDAAG